MTLYEEFLQQGAKPIELKRTLEWYKKSHDEVCTELTRVRQVATSTIQMLQGAIAEKNEEIAEKVKYFDSVVRDREACYQKIHELHTQIGALKSVSLKETPPPADWEQQGSNPPSTQAKLESIRADLRSKGISGEAYIARLIEVLIEKEQGDARAESKVNKHHVTGKNESDPYGQWFLRLKC